LLRKIIIAKTVNMNFLEGIDQELDRVIKFLENEYTSLHTGRASTGLIEDIDVEAYGAKTPLKGIANISVLDSKTINVQPWDKGVISFIEKGVRESGLNLSVVNTGELVRVIIPELTAERRTEFVRIAKDKAEEARVSVRNQRHETIEKIKKAKTNGEMSEDEVSSQEKELQKKVEIYNKKIDEVFLSKEKDLLEG